MIILLGALIIVMVNDLNAGRRGSFVFLLTDNAAVAGFAGAGFVPLTLCVVYACSIEARLNRGVNNGAEFEV